jgi:hypothetical protein
MYSMVAAATDSNVFDGPATIAALKASLPDLPAAPAITGDELRPMYIEATRIAGEAVDFAHVIAEGSASWLPAAANASGTAWGTRSG